MGKHFPKRALRFVTEAKAKALVAVHLSELEAFAPTPPTAKPSDTGKTRAGQSLPTRRTRDIAARTGYV